MARTYSIKTDDPITERTACLIAGVFEKGALPEITRRLDGDGQIAALLRDGDFRAAAGDTLLIKHPRGLRCERLLLTGLGPRKEFDDHALRKAAAAAARAVNAGGAREAGCLLTRIEGQDVPNAVRGTVESMEAALYRFEQLKSDKTKVRHPLTRIALYADTRSTTAARRALAQGRAISHGVRLAMDLGNLPGNVCTPSYLARQARALAKNTSIATTILGEAQMKKLGMGALLSVARGSRQPAKLIIMNYRGAGAKKAPIVLVGKGLTFDSGGVSIKASAQMDEMKFDMCGGASVLGTLKATAELKLPLNVIGIVPSSENMPDGDANKPGDIVTSMAGQTIEILNTDAEGRLILCDALTYAERYKPAAVIDIATLTGSCVVALGAHASGLLGNDDALVRELLEAGTRAADRAWQLPLWKEYDDQLKTNFADVANIGGREAGTITAAAFLARFAKKYPWAHLDIAGTAWKGGAKKGATGRPVPLLTEFLVRRCAGRRSKQ